MSEWKTELPEYKPRCLVTYRLKPKGVDVKIGWVDKERPQANVIAWMPMPMHITRNPDGWFSEFRGDDNPAKPGWYLVCYERNSYPEEAWYNATHIGNAVPVALGEAIGMTIVQHLQEGENNV